MSSREQIGAVVLAAGQSTRMGQPKQLLQLADRPLLEHTLSALRAAKVSEIVVVLGFAAAAIRERIGLEAVKVVVNECYEAGMGTSLGIGLSALDPRTAAALVVLADQPFVRSHTLDQIIERYQQSEASIVIPIYQGFRGNPVLLDRSVFPEVIKLKADIGCRAIFADHRDGIVLVTVEDIGILLDIDNQDDFAKAKQYRQGGHAHGPADIDLRGRAFPERDEANRERENLVIVGSEPVAIALAKIASLLDYRVIVVDPLLPESSLPEADEVLHVLDLSRISKAPPGNVVIASRGRFDEEAIEQAFAAGCSYVALVANRRRAQDVRRHLQENGHAAAKLATLRAPAGLDIGASTPGEIALSILAEMVARRRKGDTGNRATEN
jgi:CTP:molybdopterin cytidylyltransferase MocA